MSKDVSLPSAELSYAVNYIKFTHTSTVPPIVTTVEPLLLLVDTDVELICIATGVDPPDTITWMFGGTVIYTGNEMTGGNYTQTISSDDYGVYTCNASNEFGSNAATVEIIQAGIITYASVL